MLNSFQFITKMIQIMRKLKYCQLKEANLKRLCTTTIWHSGNRNLVTIKRLPAAIAGGVEA
jgi:hypothetical protein